MGTTRQNHVSKCGKEMSKFAIKRHHKICFLSKLERKEFNYIKQKQRVKCQTCGKIISDSVKLKGHIRFIHNKEKTI